VAIDNVETTPLKVTLTELFVPAVIVCVNDPVESKMFDESNKLTRNVSLPIGAGTAPLHEVGFGCGVQVIVVAGLAVPPFGVTMTCAELVELEMYSARRALLDVRAGRAM
jgi:hypothetical protein